MPDDQLEPHGGGAERFLQALRRRRATIVMFVVLVPAAALAVSLLRTKQYEASAALLFRDPGLDQKLFNSSFLEPSSDPDREAATNLELVSLEVVADRAARRLGRGLEAKELTEKVSVTTEGRSDVVQVTATDPSPAFAQRIANTFAGEYIRYRREADRSNLLQAQRLVERQLSTLPAGERTGPGGRSLRNRQRELQVLASLQTGNAELVQPAKRPEDVAKPRPVKNTLIALFLGLLLGVIAAMLRERLDRRLHGVDDAEELFRRPVLGVVPQSAGISGAHSPRDLSALEAESFRLLRANLRYFNVKRDVRSLLITSAAAGDGKSTVAWNLAAAAAGSGTRTALVEADLRNPSLTTQLALPTGNGLSHVLTGQADLDEVTYSVRVAESSGNGSDSLTMDVVTAGSLPPNPTDLIDSERMRDFVRLMEERYELVVIDTPPTSVVSDAIPLVNQVSGVIPVVRLGQSTVDAVIRLRDQLENLEAPTLGIVVNSADLSGPGYSYGYAYEAEAQPRPSGGRLADLLRQR